jgi:4-amino-4-deoxy-L-arabinose transferase-like glycosyltransferase
VAEAPDHRLEKHHQDPESATWTRPAVGRARLLLALGVVLAALLVWTVGHLGSSRSLATLDALDYAQMGRQLARGEGPTSLQTFPYELGWLRAQGHATTPPWPNLRRFPLPPVASAVAMRVVGESDLAALLPGAVGFLACALALCLVGNRLAGPWAGALGALAFVLEPTQLRYAVSGMTETPAAALLALSALLLCAALEGARPRRAAGALGLVLGLAYLTRFNAAVAVPCACLLLFWLRRPRLASPLLVSAAVAAVLAPWFAWNLARWGQLQASLTSARNLLWGVVEGDLFDSFRQVDVWAELRASGGRGGGPGSDWVIDHWSHVLSFEWAWIGPVFLLAILAPGRGRLRAMWLYTLGGLALSAIAMSGGRVVPRYFHLFTPLCLCVAAAGAVLGVAAVPRPGRRVAVPVALALLVLAALPLARRAGERPPRGPANAEAYEAVAERVPRGGVVASDRSAAVAWFADRPSVRFRGALDVLEELDRDHARVAAVLLHGRAALEFAEALPSSPLAGTFAEPELVAPGAGLWVRVPE